MLNGKPPLYDQLRVFESLRYAHNQGKKGNKFASRSKKCVFVGYPHGQKGWKLFDLDNKTYFVARDVNFFFRMSSLFFPLVMLQREVLKLKLKMQ